MNDKGIARMQGIKAKIAAIMDELDDTEDAMTAAESEALQAAWDYLDSADRALVAFT